MSERNKRSYLTKAEALNFGEFLQSDFRRLIKQREAQTKFELKMIDFIPWTQAMRLVTKKDLKVWDNLYHDHGIRNFNDLKPILKVWKD